MMYLKQSTAIEIKIGPFVDSGDGFTPETSLTISQADVRLAKNGGDWAQKTEATSFVHEENGWYADSQRVRTALHGTESLTHVLSPCEQLVGDNPRSANSLGELQGDLRLFLLDDQVRQQFANGFGRPRIGHPPCIARAESHVLTTWIDNVASEEALEDTQRCRVYLLGRQEQHIVPALAAVPLLTGDDDATLAVEETGRVDEPLLASQPVGKHPQWALRRLRLDGAGLLAAGIPASIVGVAQSTPSARATASRLGALEPPALAVSRAITVLAEVVEVAKPKAFVGPVALRDRAGFMSSRWHRFLPLVGVSLASSASIRGSRSEV